MKTFFDLGERPLADGPAEQVVADTLGVREALEQVVGDVSDGGRQQGAPCRRRRRRRALVTRRRLPPLNAALMAAAAAAAAHLVVVVGDVAVVKRHRCVAVTSPMTSFGQLRLHTS